MDTIEQRIEQAKAKLKKLSAQKQQVEARKRTEEGKRKRRDETRRKILVGAAILARVERGEWPEHKLRELMNTTLTRPDDRVLFGLPSTAGPPQEPTPDKSPATKPSADK